MTGQQSEDVARARWVTTLTTIVAVGDVASGKHHEELLFNAVGITLVVIAAACWLIAIFGHPGSKDGAK